MFLQPTRRECLCSEFLICTTVTETSVTQASATITDYYYLLPTMMSRMGIQTKVVATANRQTNRPTNRPADQPTDGPTDPPIY